MIKRSLPLTNCATICLSLAGMMTCSSNAFARGGQTQQAVGGPTFRLISETQYRDVIADVFGDDIKVSIRLPSVKRTNGLVALNAGSTIVTTGTFDQFDASARSVADQVVDKSHREALVSCAPANEHAVDNRCAAKFFTKVGKFLYRRPLSDDELAMLVNAAADAASQRKNFYSGLAASLAGMLVSPKFLFIDEIAEADPRNPGQFRLDSYSVASRLSLLLWNTYPDQELLTAAERDELHTKNGLAKQVSRMLASPRFDAGVRAFFADFLVFENFDTLSKDPVIYPAFSLRTAGAAREQALRVIVKHVVEENWDYRELFTTRETFVNDDLGSLYRIPIGRSGEWESYELPQNSPRAGLLTLISFLAVYGHPGRSSPTRRGKALREVFLCQHVPDPPPNVDFTGFEDPKNAFATARARLKAHTNNPVCAGCHKITDPIGLGLEDFDGAAQFRAEERGTPIDTSGVLDGLTFKDAVGLGRALHDHPQLPSCLVSRLYSYALGRQLTAADDAARSSWEKRFVADGFRVKDFLRELTSSNAYYAVGPPTPAESGPSALTSRNGPVVQLQEK
jgi:hypothetical protein